VGRDTPHSALRSQAQYFGHARDMMSRKNLIFFNVAFRDRVIRFFTLRRLFYLKLCDILLILNPLWTRLGR
jgi:hypothetical protein